MPSKSLLLPVPTSFMPEQIAEDIIKPRGKVLRSVVLALRLTDKESDLTEAVEVYQSVPGGLEPEDTFMPEASNV
jgi:hypothetical protein